MARIEDDDPIYKEIVAKRIKEQTDLRPEVAKLIHEKRKVEARMSSLQEAIGILDMDPSNGSYADNALKMHAFIVTQVKAIAQDKKYGKIQNDMAKCWPRLNGARVFAVPEVAYLAVRGWADRHTTEVVCKLPFNFARLGDSARHLDAALSGNPAERPGPPEEEVETYVRLMREATNAQPLPEHLPFDYTVLVYGGGAPLSEGDAMSLVGPEAQNYRHLRLLADLVCSDGVVWQFCLGIDGDGDLGFFAQGLRDANGWSCGMSLTPWIVPGIIDLINSFKKVVHEQVRGLRFRKDWEKHQKAAIKLSRRGLLHPIPPPFYKVELKQELVEDRIHARGKEMAIKHRTWQLQHRCDVRAHERIRIARGKLPIPVDIEEDLRERGYKLFTHNPLDAEASRLLIERHERPKGHDEWVALKVSWVKSHQRGPEDAPYVPALRVLPTPPGHP